MVKFENVIGAISRMDIAECEKINAAVLDRRVQLAVQKREEELMNASLADDASKHAYNHVKYMALSAPLAGEAWKFVPEADKVLYRQQFTEGPNGLMKLFKQNRLREHLIAKIIDTLVPKRGEPHDRHNPEAAKAADAAVAAEGGAEAGFDADIDGLAQEVARVALVDAFA